MEIPVKDAVMHRRLVVTCRGNSYRSPLATRLIELFAQAGQRQSRW